MHTILISVKIGTVHAYYSYANCGQMRSWSEALQNDEVKKLNIQVHVAESDQK